VFIIIIPVKRANFSHRCAGRLHSTVVHDLHRVVDNDKFAKTQVFVISLPSLFLSLSLTLSLSLSLSLSSFVTKLYGIAKAIDFFQIEIDYEVTTESKRIYAK